jgi:aminodeoxyfutalosine deaminase
MRRFSAQYIITNNSDPLKRGIITTKDDGTILNVEDTSGDLSEQESVEFYNGIITPGFVNCHCHLELSHLKGLTVKHKGIGVFIEQIRSLGKKTDTDVKNAIIETDKEMQNEGVVLCADICNNSSSFETKKNSPIKYINLLEVFGIDNEGADKRINDILAVAKVAESMDLNYYIVPHSFYSMSLQLLRLLIEITGGNRITSIHFMESPEEKIFLNDHSGSLFDSYKRSGLLPLKLETTRNHSEGILNYITTSGNLILVHNTFVNHELISKVSARKNLFWCLCPSSNAYIENAMPPVNLLLDDCCEIVIGTDSLASNEKLSILNEMKILQNSFPSLSFEELIKWATINGAKALREDNNYGKIILGKKPGLNLIENVDLQNLKLMPESIVKKLI